MTLLDSRCIELLNDVLEMPRSERGEWLVARCAGDAELLARVRRLLEIDDGSSPLDSSMHALLGHVDLGDDDDADSGAAGTRIGPYRLVRELGRGGMGTVWLAERDDGQFQQRVALKLIKRGMDSAHVHSQFLREREVLARLQHPNIAQLIDGGVDHGDRPWFAMECIEGISLHDWLEQRQPDLRERLQLFLKLCRAVGHAHQQLVVHRDLKPSNVLVQEDGEPRLLDFGIAKLVEAESNEHTALGHRFLSRDFASPEQLRGEPVTTATDVYALGLILFELLTEQRYRKVHQDGQATLRPSAALTRTTAGRTGTAAQATPAQLRGDLDAITLRALADDPERRYANVPALAQDVASYLEGRPVQARPDAFSYRAAKFVRRNALVVGIVALSTLALLATTGTALWQAREKTLEAGRTRIALRQSEATQQFLGSILLGADPSRTKGVDTTAGELLAVARARAATELADEPLIAARLLDQIGNTYVSLAQDDLARSTLQQAMDINRSATTPSLAVEASAGGRLAHYRYLDGEVGAALQEMDRIITLLQGKPDLAPILAKALQFKGSVLFATNRIDEAVETSAQAVDALRPQRDAHGAEYITALVGHADAAAGAGQGERALQAADDALAHIDASDMDAPVSLAAALGAKVRALQTLKRDAEAEPLLAEVIAVFGTMYGDNVAQTRYWRYRHAQLLQALNKLDEAQGVIDALVSQPPDTAEQPVARAAMLVTAAAIAKARDAADIGERLALAQSVACAADGHPRFCEKVHELGNTP